MPLDPALPPRAPARGLFGVNMGACASPESAVRIAALAEELGYDSLWAGEHVVVPRPRIAPSPMEPDDAILDPLVTLAHLAATTARLRLATGIVILPQRNPVVLAKQLASLDVLSAGRLVFGFGVGYLEPELRAVGVPPAGRGARADEYLAAMRALWEDEEPSFGGEHVAFAAVDAHPRPVQRPLPVIAGGHTRAAHRRAVRRADGWYGFLLDRAATAEQVASLRREAETARRAAGFTITVSPSERLTPEVVDDYAALGVDRLVPVLALGRSLEQVESFVRANAPGDAAAAAA